MNNSSRSALSTVIGAVVIVLATIAVVLSAGQMVSHAVHISYPALVDPQSSIDRQGIGTF